MRAQYPVSITRARAIQCNNVEIISIIIISNCMVNNFYQYIFDILLGPWTKNSFSLIAKANSQVRSECLQIL